MHIQIIGAGAVGLLLATRLQEANHWVTLYVRRLEQKQVLEEAGIHYVKDGQTTIYTNFSVQLMADYKSKKDQITFICVKQHAIDEIVQRIAKSGRRNDLIFLQNGMGHLVHLEKFEKPYVGIVEHGVKKVNDHTVNHLGEGAIRIAPYHVASHLVNKLFDTCRIFDLANDWQSLLHHKLLVNAVINPLTTIFKQKNRCIYENEHINYLANKLCEETATVLELDSNLMWEKVIAIAKVTRANTSSMLADYLGGKETEIDAISGYVIKNAKKPVPYTRFVYHAVLALEGGVDDE